MTSLKAYEYSSSSTEFVEAICRSNKSWDDILILFADDICDCLYTTEALQLNLSKQFVEAIKVGMTS